MSFFIWTEGTCLLRPQPFCLEENEIGDILMAEHEAPGARTPRSHFSSVLSRREFLMRTGVGFGNLALTFLLAREAEANEARGTVINNPLARKAPMFPAT